MFTSLRAAKLKLRPRGIKTQKGYTIIEVMIFLTVSLAVFATVLSTISGQNRRTAFVQSVRNVEHNLQDIFNDVETGYYSPSQYLESLGIAQGTLQQYIFMGKAIQLKRNSLEVSTIVGQRLNSSGKDVTSIEESRPDLLESLVPSTREVHYIESGVEITGFYYGGFITFNGISVVSGFPQQEGSDLRSGIVRPSLVPIGVFGSLDSSQAQFRNQTQASMLTSYRDLYAASGGVLCLQEEGDNGRTAAIEIGVDSQRLATSTIIDPSEGPCAS